MDVNIITQLIGNLGVPVACLCCTFYLWNKETESHKEEMNKMTEALNNNTIAITKLADKLKEE